jgi:PAS domain S-box-containing protein
MESLSETVLDVKDSDLGRPEIVAVREKLLNRMMYVLMAIGFPAVIVGATQAYQQGQWQFSLIYLCTYSVVLVCTLFPNKIPFAFRVLLLLLMNYAIAVAILLRIGLSGSGIVLLMAFCVIVAVMFGARYGLIAITLSLLTMATVGTGMITGFVPINIKNMLNSTSVLAWITYGSVFAMVSMLMVIAPNMFQNRLIHSMERLKHHAEELELMNQKLQREMQYRERAEHALRESEEKYRFIADNMLDLVAICDTNEDFTFVSPSYERVLGYWPDDLMGKPIYELVHQEDLAAILQVIENHRLSLEPAIAVYRMRHREGFYLWFETYGKVLFSPEGENIGAVFNTREVTDRKMMDDALRESEEKYRDLVENVNDIIFSVDTTGVITYVNPVVMRYGYQPEDLVGTVAADFVHTEDRERIARRLRYALRGVSEMGVFRFLTKDGEVRWATFNESVIRERGSVRGLRGVLSDITDRVQAEELIKTSLREKEVMLQEIHHRVKNNMQIISSLLGLQTKSVSDERDIELFNDTVYRVRSMALVHEKLYQSEDLASIDFIEYIRSLANELFASYQKNTNQVELSIVGEGVRLDVNSAIPSALIINELISNALKYAFPDDRKGTIEVSVRIDDAMNCSISVADDGVGIQDDIDIENSETLGLQLVKVLIRQLNGTVQLEREKGTRFLLNFPANKTE